jgi:hypothetical protein
MEAWPIVNNTQGGPEHDVEQRVLDPMKKPIPRLYVAGESAPSTVIFIWKLETSRSASSREKSLGRMRRQKELGGNVLGERRGPRLRRSAVD